MRESKKVLSEGLLVLVLGFAFALAANTISPRGLSLSRNYFPGATRPALPPATNQVAVVSATNAPSASSEALIAARLRERGLNVVNSNEVFTLFRDPRYQQEFIVFIDARNDRHYQEGHIPGAYQFDHYRPENYLAAVLPASQMAEQIVVYCGGGDCEDSEFAAVTLADIGVPKEKLSVYPGGMAEWATNGWPVEVGFRKSGVLRGPTP